MIQKFDSVTRFCYQETQEFRLIKVTSSATIHNFLHKTYVEQAYMRVLENFFRE